MKKFLGLLILLMMIASNCLAMTFSQPIEIGWIGISQVSKGAGGFMFKNETYNNGSYYTGYKKDNKDSYGKGNVQFGNGSDSLYVHYDAYKQNKNRVNVGSNNISNTVVLDVFNTWIYKISTDEGITFYAFREWYGPDSDWIIVGKKNDGVWVKYFYTNDVTKKYFAPSRHGASSANYGIPTCNGNTIIIRYGINGASGDKKPSGEFRFKWDDKAQWFGVEQVMY